MLILAAVLQGRALVLVHCASLVDPTPAELHAPLLVASAVAARREAEVDQVVLVAEGDKK